MAINATNYDGTKDYKIAEVGDVYHPNLLVNGDFQIIPRGGSFSNVKNGVYTAAMWRTYNINSPSLSININGNGMRLSNVIGAVNIYQLVDTSNLIGEKFVFQYSIDGIISKKTGSISSAQTEFAINVSKNCTINWAYATVGNEVYQYIPEDARIALLRSQRYVQNLGDLFFNVPCVIGFNIEYNISYNFYTPMKSKPTVRADAYGIGNVGENLTEPISIDATTNNIYQVIVNNKNGKYTVTNGNPQNRLHIDNVVLSCEPL